VLLLKTKKRFWWISSTALLIVLFAYSCFVPIDYSRLESNLKEGNWEVASKLTSEFILRISGQGLTGSWNALLGKENSLKKFSCEELLKLDSLWVKYSNNYFGLSVQWEIFNLFNVKDFNGDYFSIYDAFFNVLGWENLDEHNFSPIYSPEAPRGHLPLGDWMIRAGNVKTNPWIDNGLYLYQRLEACKSS
jgi:hypothetical protein